MSLDEHTWFRSGFPLISIVHSSGVPARLSLFIDDSIAWFRSRRRDHFKNARESRRSLRATIR